MQPHKLFWLLCVLFLTSCAPTARPRLTATSDVPVSPTVLPPPTTKAPASPLLPTRTPRSVQTPTATKEPTRVPTPTFAPLTAKLPQALYFIGAGTFITNAGTQPYQIWRLDPESMTLTEITHENYDIKVFDVSLSTGRLAYVLNQSTSNRLVLIQPDGTGRQVIADESLTDDGLNLVDNPHWSPGGQTLAFSQGGLNFYRVVDGQVVKAVSNHIDVEAPTNSRRYAPKFWSPNGKLLLVVEEGWEGGLWMLYDVEAGTLTNLESPYGYNEGAAWSSDSSLVFFTTSYLMGDGCRDLWQFNTFTRRKTVAVPCLFSEAGYSNAGWPWLNASGDLFYLYNYSENIDVYLNGQIPPWQLMRLPHDQPDSPLPLRSDIPKEVSEVLWDSEGKLAIVNLSGSGPLVLVPTDASQAIQLLVTGGANLRWGP